jgi:hypothetical protein
MSHNDFALTSRRVIVGSEMRPATVIIRGGIIDEVASVSLQKHELPVEDVGDLIVMPGLVDTHVHINEPGRSEWEGFEQLHSQRQPAALRLLWTCHSIAPLGQPPPMPQRGRLIPCPANSGLTVGFKMALTRLAMSHTCGSPKSFLISDQKQ